MIATVVFFKEEQVLQGMLVCDMWVAAMCKGAREVFIGIGAQLEDMKFIGGVRCRLEKEMEEGWSFWGI